jgi:hypothetical protein
MKKYEAIEGTNIELKIQVYYSKGGMNYFQGVNEARGYYISVSPVERSTGDGYTIESSTAFSGTKKLLLEVKRLSNKAYDEAVKLAEAHEAYLKDHVLRKNNLLTEVKELVIKG